MLARQLSALANRAEPSSTQRDELVRQAGIAGGLGSPFVQRVLEAAWRQLDNAPRLGATVDHWPGDVAADAVAMRLNAGLHALARRTTFPALTRLYRERAGDFDRVIGEALALGEDELLQWLHWPTQTNEIARSSAFIAALLVASVGDPRPVELLEIGASAGLNLNLARYRHVLGGVVCGDSRSDVTLEPDWTGPPPPRTTLDIVSARGVDLRPVAITAPGAQERMMAFVWADRDDRASRLAAAIAVAQIHPPKVDRGDALQWLTERLRAPQPDGVRRVIVHSMVAQYLGVSDRRGLFDAIVKAGGRASRQRPLAWISLEWTRNRREVQLHLTSWPDSQGEGRITTLASCHPYGDSLRWFGPSQTL